MANYAHDDLNNRVETLSKEEIYALLADAIEQGQLPSVDTPNAFVTMVKSIVDGQPYKIGFCTQAQYNELKAEDELEDNALYFITDDTTLEELDTKYTNMINEQILQVQKPPLASINADFDFVDWNTTTSTRGFSYIGFEHNTTTGFYNNPLYLLPLDSIKAVAEAKIEYLSGANGYLRYDLDSILANNNYLEFKAVKIFSGYIYPPNYSGSGTYTTRSTTFRLTIKDIYNNIITQDFTVNYKTSE